MSDQSLGRYNKKPIMRVQKAEVRPHVQAGRLVLGPAADDAERIKGIAVHQGQRRQAHKYRFVPPRRLVRSY